MSAIAAESGRNAVAVSDPGALIESVIVKGDLSKLTADERMQYYMRVCESAKLNPLTRPFEYLTLNNRLVLYARKDATDQLRSIHGISVTDLSETERDGVLIVTAKVQNAEGRTDMAKGAVTIGNLKGDALANACMKAETKAKRRATLSICGLGFLDELEVETIHGAEPANGNGAPKRTREQISAEASRKRQDLRDCESDINQMETLYALEKYEAEVLTPEFMAGLGMKSYALANTLENRRRDLQQAAEAEAVQADDLEPGESTKADYIRECHDAINGFTVEPALLAWWNSKEEKTARREFALTKDELAQLMARVFERREEIMKANTEEVLA